MIRLGGSRLASAPLDAKTLVTTLAWLRPCAALGQALAVVATAIWVSNALPLAPLTVAILLLLLASAGTFWRLRRSWPVTEFEAVLHIAFDLLVLGWALYFTGGTSNPFTTLLLVPVALTAAALSVRSIGVIAILAGIVYAVLLFHHVPLPDMPTYGGTGLRLHVAGLSINFLIAGLLLAVFIGRMTASLRRQRETTTNLRERTLRDEGILAVASQAATAAHDLNTPLSTLRTLLPELVRDRESDEALRDDVQLLIGEVERCRSILERMVDYGRRQLAGGAETTTLGEYVRSNVARFQLLCPEADVRAQVAVSLSQHPIEVAPGLAHALLNLLRNAYDASMKNHSRLVTLDVRERDDEVEFAIGDHGQGLSEKALDQLLGASDKPDGLGMGLALARSTIERLRGEFDAERSVDGTHVYVRLPVTGGSAS